MNRTAAVLILFACADLAPAGAPDADLKKLQGAWRLVHEISDGAEEPQATIAGTRLIVAADGAWRVEKDGKLVGAGTMALGSANKPKTIDYAFTQGEAKGSAFTAIYELEGDTFRQCGVLEGARPGDFAAPTGSKRFLATFRRVIDVPPTRGRYFDATYPPSEKLGTLQLGATYTVWLPPGVKTIRGVIVHQHGCGVGACSGGATAAYDLHWQALAKKWDCALLGPSYHQADGQNCRLWCDPRNGSAATFLKALDDFAAASGHAELKTAPWCLWGHSGGGFWASLMQALYPERVVAVWCRSGTAYHALTKGEIARPPVLPAVYDVPVMFNPGAKEKGDKRFDGAWTGSLAMFEEYRRAGAPAGFAPDPRTAHECGDSRYLAIAFFDACLAQRLPEAGAAKLRRMDADAAWLARPTGSRPMPAPIYLGAAREAVWLPNQRVAKAWADYVKTGAVPDDTPPPPPFAVRVQRQGDDVEITWDAEADFESGLRGFIIERDGKDLAQAPPQPVGRFGLPLFQTMSYHDTPERPLPVMRFLDRVPGGAALPEYRVSTVNGAGLRSAPTKP